jgi:hypothetical protein
MTRWKRAALALVLVQALAASARAASPEILIDWDKDLAFDWDRENYERTIRALVEQAHAEASSWLGMPLRRPLTIRVLTPARYEATFGDEQARRCGAHYSSGTIYTNGGARLDAWFAGMLSHELAHALVDVRGTGARLPMWLNEGIAERVEAQRRGTDRLDGVQVNRLESALDQRTLVPLPRGYPLSEFGYLQCFAAILFLEAELGHEKLTATIRRAVEGAGFEKALESEAGWTPRKVEEGFAHWVDHLQ